MPKKRKKAVPQHIIPENIPQDDAITSVDNLLPEANVEIGILGEEPIPGTSDIKGSKRLIKAGEAGGGGSGEGSHCG